MPSYGVPLAALAIVLLTSPVFGQSAPSVDAYVGLKYPAALAWSPDGRRVAYEMGATTGSEIRVNDARTGARTALIRDVPSDRYARDLPDLRWSPDGNRLIYRARTSYYAVQSSGGIPIVFFSDTAAQGRVELSPDLSMVSYTRGDELWLRALDSGKSISIGKTSTSPSTQWPSWSPDGRYLAHIVPDSQRGTRVGVVNVTTGETRWISQDTTVVWTGTTLVWSPDAKQLAISRQSADMRRKTLSVADVGSGESATLWTDTDDKWVTQNYHPGFTPAWSPDGSKIALISIRDGWDHIYIIDAESDGRQRANGDVATLTPGAYQALWVQWMSDHDLVAVTSQGNLHGNIPYRIDVDEGKAVQLTPGPGVTADVEWLLTTLPWPVLSPDHKHVLFSFTTPDDFAQIRVAATDVVGAPSSRTMYSTVADGFPQSGLGHINAVSFKSADGSTVPAVLIKPRNLDTHVRHPALVHMYCGWGQMATLGRSLEWKSRVLDYLVSRGVVVLVVDCRGSDGYGNAWAHGLYGDGGGKQSDDLIAGARYLRTLPYIDRKAIGLFGHSYAGYLTVATLLRDPDAFNAGFPSGGVYDWKIFGTALKTPYVYVRFVTPEVLESQGRPARHLDRLKTPILDLHGMLDVNGPFAQSDTLVKYLLAGHKRFEFMPYPDEPHHLNSPDDVRDYMLRMERFLKTVNSYPSASHR